MKKWNENGNTYMISDITKQITKLPTGVYTLDKSMYGLYLTKIDSDFKFNHKVYGIESDLINRVIKTWKNTNKNLGVLLNGLKGTGKTVTAKLISNELNIPVILINSNPEDGGIPEFLNSIEQEVIVLIDEYEKIFHDDSELLTVMDGVLTSTYRKLFLLTTNQLRVNDSLLQRPSRIRYCKTFKDLSQSTIIEIIDDILIYPEFKQDLLSTISSLEVITIDVVKALIEEVNIHNEGPSKFFDVFNVRKITGRYNLYKQVVDANNNPTEELMYSGVKLYPREFDMDWVGHYVEVDNTMIGEITDVLEFDTIVLAPLDKTKGKKAKPDPITIRIEAYNSIHRNFRNLIF